MCCTRIGLALSLLAVACGEESSGRYGPSPPASPEDYCAATENWDAGWTQWEEDVLTLTNLRRIAGDRCAGVTMPAVGELTMNAALQCAARKHALDMAAQDYMDHTSPDGVTAAMRIDWADYAWIARGENVAGGYANPTAAVAGWMSSEGHCLNIMRGTFVEIGVAYVVDADPVEYGSYWVQVFGTPP